ncbi:hypothetical protein [Streptomyces sp. NPDC005438]|uniref:hypothetical protein n=1 Tax=Streptomyces sp. NPDC005438 TaxID=3156880 RepID=UPI0033B077B9
MANSTRKTTNAATRSAKETASSAKQAAKSAGESTLENGRSAGRATAETVSTAQQQARKTLGKISSRATIGWNLIKHRKAVAVGAAAGVIGLLGGAFAAGRATERSGRGPVTRYTKGRI